MGDAKKIQDFLNKEFKGMRNVRQFSKRELREQQERELAEAITEIKQKYFSNAMQKKQPNM